jgi:hypothetical protein
MFAFLLFGSIFGGTLYLMMRGHKRLFQGMR